MKKIIVCLVILLSFQLLHAQNCLDPSRLPDPYFQCLDPLYEPVCGCDNITYRNRCAAENWGGLINDGFSIGWIENTVCGNFDFDFNPTGVTNIGSVKFNLFMKNSGSATLYIYNINRYGELIYSDYFNASFPNQIISRDINLQFLEIGIYAAVVVVNEEKLAKKFGKVVESTAR